MCWEHTQSNNKENELYLHLKNIAVQLQIVNFVSLLAEKKIEVSSAVHIYLSKQRGDTMQQTETDLTRLCLRNVAMFDT